MAHVAQRLFVSLMLAAGAMAAPAADFPSSPVRLVVPVSAGGTIDTAARLIAAKLRDSWRQPVIIENRVGASSAIGVDYVAKSAPDGHTLLTSAWSLMLAVPHLQRTPYDVIRDLVAVVQTATINYVLVAHPKTGVSTIGELVELATKNPGRLNYASGGNGSGNHLYAELLMRAAKIKLTHIPYKGDGPALQALVAGEVDVLWSATGNVIPFVRAGKVRGLLVTGAKPVEGLPNVPVIDTVYPGLFTDAWLGIFAPAATPKAVVDQIAADVRAAVLSPDLSSRILEMGFEPTGVPSERFSEIVRGDYKRWGQIIRENNIRAN